MKHLRQITLSIIFILYILPLFAQPYRVQIAAYINKVPFSYFTEAEIFGVYMLTDQNNIYRYYMGGEYREKEHAENVVNEARKKGFKNAHVINIEEQRRLCGKPCPYISPKSTYSDASTELLTLNNIFFGFNRSTLSIKAKRELDKVCEILKANPDFKILVSGHTDSMGSAKYNLALSKRRARTSKSYLIAKGIKSSRITAEVFGESVPEMRNVDEDGHDNPKGRGFNRRVVLAIFDSENGQIILNQR